MKTATAKKQKEVATDKELAIKMQTGSASEKQTAFNELYKRFKDKIYITFFRALNVLEKEETAKDLSQNVFMKVFNKIDSFNVEASAFTTWIYTIAHNELIDFKRNHKFEILNYEGLRTKHESDNANAELVFQVVCKDKLADEVFDSSQRAAAIQKAISSALKSEQMRDMVALRYFEEFSYDEIAERMDIPKGTVKSTLSRAKEMLKEYLETNTTIAS